MPRFLVVFLLLFFNGLVFGLAWQNVAVIAPVGAQPEIKEEEEGETAVFTNTDFLYPHHLPAGVGHGQTDGPDDQLTLADRDQIQQQLQQSILALQDQLPALSPTAVTFTWPLRNAPLITDYGNHAVANFVDQNPNFPNQLRDYACGDRTYDSSGGYNHAGTDLFIWPFSWYKMDHDEVEVITAAPGIIIYKSDGNYDRSCSFNSNSWNAVYVRHTDGSVAWYGHLKRGSLTNKPVGSLVNRGEYLGVVGSSGNSTGPHLHFEVHTATNALIDPFAGSCNPLNTQSWWQEQPAYYDSAVNAVTTGTGAPVFPSCPQPENGRQEDSFSAGNRIYFTTYYRDQLGTQTSLYTIYQPDGNEYQSWTHSINPDHYAASYWYWYFNMPGNAMPGTWKFEVNYWGHTYHTYFNIDAPIYLTLTEPITNTTWITGETYSITWQDNLGGAVQVGLFQENQLLELFGTFTDPLNTTTWSVPMTYPLGTDYQLRAINATNATLSDTVNLWILGPIDVYLPVVRRNGPNDKS